MTKLLLLILISFSIFAQDEWFFNDMLNGDVKLPAPELMRRHYYSNPKNIAIDITGDGKKEYFRFQNIDGKTYVKVFDGDKKLVIEQKFEIKGFDAKPDKIIKKIISKNSVAIFIVFFEGKTGYLQKQASSSLYGAVSDNGNLENFKFKKLTSVWLEHEKLDNYIRRPYNIEFEDIDRDGITELIVKSGIVKRIFFYDSNNNWKQ